MTNQYYVPDSGNVARPGQTVRSAQFNDNNNTIEQGFDLLPAPMDLFSNRQNFGIATSSVANVYEVDVSPTVLTSFQDGMQVEVRFPSANTGPAQLNLNSLGVKQIRTIQGQPVRDGDIVANASGGLRFDLANDWWQLDTALSTTQNFANQAAASAAAAATSEGNAAQSEANADQDAISAAEDAARAEAAAQVAQAGSVPILQPRQLGDGVTRVFNSPQTLVVDPETLFVHENGEKSRPITEYTSPNVGQVEFVTAPAMGVEIDILWFAPVVLPTPDLPIIATGSTTARVLSNRFADSVNIKDFGAVGDGVTDDSAAIQLAIKFCYDNDMSLDGARGLFRVNTTIFIPRHTNGSNGLDRLKTLDFAGASFLPQDGGTVFESGEFLNGAWSSTIENAEGDGNTFNVEIKNFSVVGGRYGIRLNNYHQGCIVHNVTSNETNTIVDLNHCFYTRLDRISSFSSQVRPWTDERFIIRGASNLMSFTNLVAVNSGIGYKFDNATSGFAAINFEQNSIEGCEIGMQFTGIVNTVGIKDNYFENIFDACMKFDNEARSAVVENNYFNLSSNSGVFMFETANNTASRLVFDASNEVLGFPDDRLFKDSATAFNTFIIDRGNAQANSLNDIAVDPGDFPRNSIVDGFRQFGFDEGIAKLNRGIIPANYSGRMTSGFDVSTGLYGLINSANTTTSLTLGTRIDHQERQFLYLSVRINDDGGFTFFRGFIIGDLFWEFGASAFAINTDVVISADADEYVRIVIGGLTNFTALNGGECRVI